VQACVIFGECRRNAREAARIFSDRFPDRPSPDHKTILRVELVPTLMIDDAETKMRTEASVLFELKTSVPFCHALQICELIYVGYLFGEKPTSP
jgi:hypothetical protein